MPALQKLHIWGVRNLSSVEIMPSPQFNLIWGDNGSGKTSILEAIYTLSLGRTFRSHQQRPLIQDLASEAVVSCHLENGFTLGIKRHRAANKGIELRMNGGKVESIATHTRELPLQLLNNESFNIIEGSPQERRAFLDWGVFHVKHSFLQAWRNTRRALQNRNALLKKQAAVTLLEPWTYEFIKNANTVDEMRRHYIEELQLELSGDLGAELQDYLGASLSLSYRCGWDPELGLEKQLQANLSRELLYGHSLFGPQLCDIEFRLNGKLCSNLLSRGQLKLTLGLLKIAQARQLFLSTGKAPIFLIDDLPAELDKVNQARLLNHLSGLQSQVFVTAIEANSIPTSPDTIKEFGLFHVKHGRIYA
jgi:DNA replication and repair protein RecF